MNTALVFLVLASTAVILILLGVNVSIAILVSLPAYSIPTLRWRLPEVALSAFNTTMLSTVTSLFLTLSLANLYSYTGISKKPVGSFEWFGDRFAPVAIPAVIGMLPTPAGAYVSATMVDNVYRKVGLNDVEKAFINYWV